MLFCFLLIPTIVNHYGLACWEHCSSSGNCNFCGDGACCRIGGMFDGMISACAFGRNGCYGYHCCVLSSDASPPPTLLLPPPPISPPPISPPTPQFNSSSIGVRCPCEDLCYLCYNDNPQECTFAINCGCNCIPPNPSPSPPSPPPSYTYVQSTLTANMRRGCTLTQSEDCGPCHDAADPHYYNGNNPGNACDHRQYCDSYLRGSYNGQVHYWLCNEGLSAPWLGYGTGGLTHTIFVRTGSQYAPNPNPRPPPPSPPTPPPPANTICGRWPSICDGTWPNDTNIDLANGAFGQPIEAPYQLSFSSTRISPI